MPKLTVAIELKTLLKYKNFIKEKIDWSKYGKETKDGGIKKVEIIEETDELREKTRFKTQMDLQAKQ